MWKRRDLLAERVERARRARRTGTASPPAQDAPARQPPARARRRPRAAPSRQRSAVDDGVAGQRRSSTPGAKVHEVSTATRHTIVTFACCSVARAARELRAPCTRVLAELVASSPRRPAPPAARRCRAAGEVLCGACLPRAPWLRGPLPALRAAAPPARGCPARRAAFDRAWAPLAYEGAARDARARAEVPRRAARRGPDGRAAGRRPAARPAPGRIAAPRSCRCRPPHPRPPPAAGVRPRRRCSPRRSPPRRAAARAVPAARGPAAGGRSARPRARAAAPGGFAVAPRPRRRRRGAARRRRPHHRRDARRLRPRAEGGGCGVGGGR